MLRCVFGHTCLADLVNGDVYVAFRGCVGLFFLVFWVRDMLKNSTVEQLVKFNEFIFFRESVVSTQSPRSPWG